MFVWCGQGQLGFHCFLPVTVRNELFFQCKTVPLFLSYFRDLYVQSSNFQVTFGYSENIWHYFLCSCALFLESCIYNTVMLEVSVWNQLLYLMPSYLQIIVIWQICLLFKILLQNIDAMKTENDVDVQSEGDPIAMSTVEVYVPSVKVESEVSFVFRWFVMVVVHTCVYVFVCMCLIPVVYYMTFSFCFEEYCFVGLMHCSLLEIHRYRVGHEKVACLPFAFGYCINEKVAWVHSIA